MSQPLPVVVDVQIACSDAAVPAAGDIKAWVLRAVAASGKTLAGRREVSVRVVDEAEIRRLNADYRGRDTATNVLSFPAEEAVGLPADAVQVLGDIVICAAVVADEATRQAKPADDHWAHMLVHGTLHLLGFDHEEEADALEMESLEERILAKEGVMAPYRSPL